MKALYVLPLLALTAGCLQEGGGPSGTETETWIVEGYQLPVNDWFGRRLGAVVTPEGESEPRASFSAVQGLDWQWGHRYEVEIERVELEDPPEDAPSTEIHLVETISDEPLAAQSAFVSQNASAPEGAEPEFVLDPAHTSGEWLGTPFVCASALGDELATLVADEALASFTWGFSEGPDLPLVLQEID